MIARSKENLVLVNAFLTNSLVLRGLIDYLGRYFFDHYPLEVSEDYFQTRFPQEDIQEIIVFFGAQSPASFS